MPNELDETQTQYINPEGREAHVINKQIPVTITKGSKVFEFFLWFPLILPGVIFALMKLSARGYLQQCQQKIQHAASTIDNYQTQRVVVLQNAAKLLDKSIDLDKETFAEIARLRSGNSDQARNELQGKLDQVANKINVAFENYPDLKAHAQIASVMQQNLYLQQEITAARELYNDAVLRWNTEIFAWPTKMIVAAKQGYTTRIPFTASQEMKAKSESVFF